MASEIPGSPPNLAQRDLRQREILPPAKLAGCSATVVGVGAIGRQVALQLAAIGLPRLQLVDPDTVEVVNLAAQGYLEEDLGQSKVEATAAYCRRIHSRIELELCPEVFRRSLAVGQVLFCCVDSIATRRWIWDLVHHRVELFLDARMSAEVIRVLAAADERSRGYYPATLFPSPEAYPAPCTARSTIFTASIAAGLMLENFARWLRGMPLEADLTLNLLASELSPGA